MMKAMKLGLLACGLLSVALTSHMASAQETLIFVRHGEKPTSSSGQFNLQRAEPRTGAAGRVTATLWQS
ncbi:hypothetical protein ACVWVT_004136 [Ewingella americana]